jgi:hypothetical protein
MNAGRATTIGAILVIPLLLWVWVSSAKNDLITRTRALVKQIKVDQGSEERELAAQARLFIRFRLPDGNPDRQEELFGRFWWDVKRLEPATYAYGASDRKEGSDGHTHSYREVIIHGKDPEGKPLALRVQWMQNRGNWYIDDYQREP